MELKYFFDTYALYEFISGKESYKKYFQKYHVVTTWLNLVELFHKIARDHDVEMARKYYFFFKSFIIDISDEIVEKAVLFRIEQMKQRKNLSYADCIGYQLALHNNLFFLTGDGAFERMKNVEFVV